MASGNQINAAVLRSIAERLANNRVQAADARTAKAFAVNFDGESLQAWEARAKAAQVHAEDADAQAVAAEASARAVK